jgi:hypothetical protein
MTTTHVAPHLTYQLLNTIQAKTVGQLTIADLKTLLDAANRVPLGNVPTTTVAQLFP